jgi:hypothetical protein
VGVEISFDIYLLSLYLKPVEKAAEIFYQIIYSERKEEEDDEKVHDS